MSDNAPELTSKATFFWLRRQAYSRASYSPETAAGHLRQQLQLQVLGLRPHLHWLASPDDPKWTIDEWRVNYNELEPVDHWPASRLPLSLEKWPDVPTFT